MTDLGFTGGGKGAGMVYVAGRPDHKMDNENMVDHIVASSKPVLPRSKRKGPQAAE
jgi:(E)-4-hydroxy-3-methylbut-2-enyl-diphosphate synthase